MKRDLPYVYLETGPDSPRGSEVGILLYMDGDECDFVRDTAGRWGASTMRLEEDGTYDLSWSQRAINRLLQNGWVEPVAWNERMTPVRVRRTDKPGISPYGADC